MEAVSTFEIFLLIFISCAFSLGGGNGQIPIIQGQWVETGVLAPGLFSFALALSYLTPGPKAGFIAGIGYYLGGLTGAIVAILGLAIPTCLSASGVSFAYAKANKVVALVKPSAGFIIAGLIGAAAWGTAESMQIGYFEVISICTIAFLIYWKNIEPILLILGGACLGLFLSWFQYFS